MTDLMLQQILGGAFLGAIMEVVPLFTIVLLRLQMVRENADLQKLVVAVTGITLVLMSASFYLVASNVPNPRVFWMSAGFAALTLVIPGMLLIRRSRRPTDGSASRKGGVQRCNRGARMPFRFYLSLNDLPDLLVPFEIQLHKNVLLFHKRLIAYL